MKDDSNEQNQNQNQNQNQSNLSDEAVKRYLYLYCALCTKKNELLPGLIDAYVQVWHFTLQKTVKKKFYVFGCFFFLIFCPFEKKMSQPVKRVMHQECLGTMRAIGLTSPVLLSIIQSIPAGSEQFLLHFLHVLTENGNFSSKIQIKKKKKGPKYK